MSLPIRTFSLLIVLIMPMGLLGGCLSTYIAAAEMAFEDRSAGDIAKDIEIKTKTLANIADQIGAEEAATVNVDVYEQVILLTGSVDKGQKKNQIKKVAAGEIGVKKVIQEIQMAAQKKSTSTTVEGVVDDIWIENKILAQASTDERISHTNWRWRSVNGVVYLFGRSLSGTEKRAMRDTVKGISGVKRIVDHSFIRAKAAS